MQREFGRFREYTVGIMESLPRRSGRASRKKRPVVWAGLSFFCICLMPAHAQDSWRWMVVAGDTPSAERLCWVPFNSSMLIVVPGKEEECWRRIVGAVQLDAGLSRDRGLAQLCAIAAQKLSNPAEQCSAGKVQRASKALDGPTGGIIQETHPDVVAILKNISRVYNVTEYELDGEVTETNTKTERGNTSHVRLVFKGPNQYRTEGSGPGLAFRQLTSGEVLVVYDGSTLWCYLPNENRFLSIPSVLLDQDRGDLSDAKPEAFDAFVMQKYRGAKDFSAEAKFVGEKTIQIAGAEIVCYVLSVAGDRWWVDKASSRIVREDSDQTSVVFTTIKLGEPLPYSLFQFTPPAGAQQIQQ